MEEDRYMRITLRIPRDLHARLDRMAEQTSKSLNAEIVGRLEESFAAPVAAFQREADFQIAAIQSRAALMNMRFELARSRVDSLQFRMELITSEGNRLIKEAQTDEDFARAQSYIEKLGPLETELEDLRKEMIAIKKERADAVAELDEMSKTMSAAADALDERVRVGRAAQTAARAGKVD